MGLTGGCDGLGDRARRVVNKPSSSYNLRQSNGAGPHRPGKESALRARAPFEAALVALATLLFQLPFFDRWFSVMDEGHMLAFADLIHQGGMLYRDATSYPLPGAFYLLSLAFAVFEPSILVSRVLVVLEFAALAALVYAIMRRIVPGGYAVATVPVLWLYRAWSFPHWQLYSYSTTALLLLTASLYLLVRFLGSGRRGHLAGAGLLLGLGVFCKQDYGAATLLAASVTLAIHARRAGASFPRLYALYLGPAAAVGVAAGLHFAIQGQLAFVVQLTVLNHFVGMSSYEYPAFPSLLPLFRQDPALRDVVGLHAWVPGLIVSSGPDWKPVIQSPLYRDTALYDTLVKLFIYGPPLLLAGGTARLWRIRRRAERRDAGAAELALTLFAAAFVLLSFVYKPQDYVHLAVLYWPLLCLGVVYAHAALGSRPRLAAAVAVLVLAPALAQTGSLLWGIRTLHAAPVPGERAGVSAKPEQARMLGEIVDHVRATSAPGEAVAAMPYFSIVQFLADRRGPHAASYIVWPFPEYPDRDRRIIDAMEAQRTDLVIYNFTQFPGFPPVEEYAPELWRYLVDHFEMERVFGDEPLGYEVAALRRQRPDPVGRPLLPADGVPGDLAIESARGVRRGVPASERTRQLRREVWPFRPVLALRPSPDGARTVLSLPLDVAPGDRLRTAVGFHPDAWFVFPTAAVRFELRARDGDREEVLYERRLDPHLQIGDRGWHPVDVPLERFAGREIVLELSTSAEGRSAAVPRMGGWAEPFVASGVE